MGTFVNNLRLLEITTGDESGTWGTKTNLNLELIADAFGSGTEAITTNADTHTTTIADGAADEGRAIFLKYTGTLDSACTITLAPNTVNKLWFIENATSGSQNIIISQGSGANITIGNGNVAAVYTDGAGSGAAVLDAFADLELSSTLTVAGNVDFNGDLDVDGTTNLDAVDIDGAVDMASTLTVAGDVTVDTSTLKVDTSNNRVGIGTASPDTLLHVDGGTDISMSSTAAGQIKIGGNAYNAAIALDGSNMNIYHNSSSRGIVLGTNETARMTVAGGGNVGIGIASATELLEIASTSTNEGIQVSCWSSTQSSAGTIRLAHSLSGTVGSHTAVTSGDQLGRIFFAGSDGTDFYSGAAIIADSTQAYTGTNGGTRLEFYTTPNGSQSRSEAMMIDQNGHIGIGTSSPDALLELKESSTAAADAVIRLRGHGNNADNTVLGALEWYNADSSGDQPGVVCRIEGVSGNSNGHMGEILFKTHDGSEGGSGSNPVERMRIDNSGDVGIGTASPSEKLDVVGNVTISGSLSKGSGSFKIDHPLPEMSDTHHLVHSFIEGPKADLIYRGSVALVDGAATVDLDAAATMTSGTWEVLCRDPQVWVQNEDGWTQVRGSISGSTLSIEAQDAACTDTVSWLVVAERKDPNIVGASLTDEEGRVIVEPLKNIET